MKHVAIIGCGVIGAAIAYELSKADVDKSLQITVFDRQPPAQSATGAALGVLMGVISQKTRGRAWEMRQTSIRRYETLIPELEAITGHSIPWNQQGILMLRFEPGDQATWEKLMEARRSQGWKLQLWDREKVQAYCPQVVNSRVVGAVYSPQDRQIDPVALTQALVAAAQQRGVQFRFDAAIEQWFATPDQPHPYCLQLAGAAVAADWIVIAAGLGSTGLTSMAQKPINIQPVLGQAMRVKLSAPLGDVHFQPVISGEDVHIVPLGQGEYWVGATVEFPAVTGEVSANADRLQEVWQGAISLCPELAAAEIVSTWSGLRPRPSDRPAPVIEPLPEYPHVLVATGHYRNGILLAPATALAVRETIGGQSTDFYPR